MRTEMVVVIGGESGDNDCVVMVFVLGLCWK